MSSLKKEVEQGNFKICYQIGIMYKYGITTKKNILEALCYWFLGLENNITSCKVPLKLHFMHNEKQLDIHKKASDNGVIKYAKRWSLIVKHGIHEKT